MSFIFFFFEKIPSCYIFQENKLTRLFFSTIRIVIGSQCVRKELSIDCVFEATSGGALNFHDLFVTRPFSCDCSVTTY